MMPSISVKTPAGKDAGTVDLPEAVFGIEPNGPVLHQVVTAQLAARRAGTQSTKTRSEVRGGGAKPWKQKGTGRARAGSSRSPIWRGGGVALGPKPRSYSQKTPKKMIRLALRSALSDRAADGQIIVLDEWGFDAPKTKNAIAALKALGIEGRALVVAERDDLNTWRSFANLGHVHVLAPGELNAYDVLVADTVIFTKATLPADAPVAEKAPVAKKAAPAVSGDDAPLSASEVVDSDADGSVNADDASPFGEGSAKAGSEGEAPSDEFVIKGNADSMLYHPPESPFYGRTVAEVWFTTAEAAEAAGFQLPPSMRDDASADDSAPSTEDGPDGSSGDEAEEE